MFSRFKNLLFNVLLSLLILTTVNNVIASQNIPFTDLKPIIDGIVDEDFWQSALEIELAYENTPANNTVATISTVARIIRDDSYIYVSFMAEDPQPEKINASIKDRDSLLSDDWVGVALDSFNDERRGYVFYINPYGSQMDFIYNDVLKKEDNSWNAVWESAGKITDSGYQIEIAIPFSSLKYSDSDKDRQWGINFMRNYPRDVVYRFSNIVVDRNKNCLLCQYQKYSGMNAAENNGIGLEITPSISMTQSESRTPDQGEWSNSNSQEAGVDLNWNINSQNSLSATINPDFSQVESDSLQLDVNTPFALFFPEKRIFFLESTDYFQTPVNVVFTRNIVDPDLGFKATGKNDGHMYGAFYTEDTVTSFIIPGSLSSSIGIQNSPGDSFVGRYRYDIGETSTFGILATNRKSQDYSNNLISIDGSYSVNEHHSLIYQALQSETKYPDELAIAHEQPLGSFSGDGLYLTYQHKNKNWNNRIRIRDYSDGFRADMGFLSKVGYKRLESYNDYFLYGEKANLWTKIRLHLNWTVTHDQNDQMIRRGNEAAIEIRGPLQSILYLNLANLSHFWEGVLYDEFYIETYALVRPTKKLSIQLATTIGDEIDFANNRLAQATNIALSTEYTFSDHFTVSSDVSYKELENQNTRIITALIGDLRLSYQFDLKHRLELTLQDQYINKNQEMYIEPTNQISKDYATRLIYSYKINPKTVLYAGYSDNAIANDDIVSLYKTQKTGFLKFSYSFNL